MDQMLQLMQKHFEECSYECGKNYKDGYNVELLQDKLDPIVLATNLVRIVIDAIRTQEEISPERKIEIQLIYQSIEKILSILKSDKNNVAYNNILCKIIGYCIKNYKVYK